MPQVNGDAAASKQPNRSHRAASRVVVPAIPLPLSKPKPARPQPKHDTTNASTAPTPTAPQEVIVNGSRDTDAHTSFAPSQLQENGQARAQVNGQAANEQDGQAINESTSSEHISAQENAVEDAADMSTAMVNGHDTATSPTVTSSPRAARKPVDRLDMRPIRTELPPAFVPSMDQQHTPQSAASSHAHQPNPALPHAHPRHPSANNIVFGSRDSSNASPVPPLSASSAFMPPPFTGHAPFFGHGHHASEPQAPRMHHPAHPQAHMNRPVRWDPSAHAPSPYHHPHAHMPFRYPPRDHYPPNGAAIPNGYGPRSRSGSQASSATHGVGAELQSPPGLDRGMDGARMAFPDPAPISHHPPRFGPAFPQQPMQITPPPFAHPDFTTGLENAESLRDHVLTHFRRPELSDCQLQILEADGIGRQYLDGHKIVLARSSTLLSIIRNSEPAMSASLKTQVHVLLKGRYVRVGSFLEAVRYLYGGPLPSPDTFGPSFAHLGHEERMEVALQHIATGAWLNVAAIAGRGVEMAASLLNWESLPSALTFALDGGIGQMWPIEDGSEERVSTCSSDDSFTKPEAGGLPTYDPYSSGLLHRIIEFTVQNLPSNFYLDPIAPQLASCPRLPVLPLHESKPSRSDPRLVKIRFGEFEDEKRPSPLTTTMSSILLSLPFPLLKFLLEHPLLSNRLGPETVSSIMRQVVNEREVRRLRTLKARTVSNIEDGHDRTLVQNLFWEESVEQSAHHKAGFRLARKRRGIDTPPSSGAQSEVAK